MDRLAWEIKQPSDGNCVVTGCDHALAWMLPWWYNCYIKNNGYPIIWADFGLTKSDRQWCEERGVVVEVGDVGVRKTWFKKPQALLKSPYKRIIWMDLDCEVCGDIGPIFEFARGFGVTLDPHNPHCRNHLPIQSGVIAVCHGHPLIETWANECMTSPLRGDQEVLNALIVDDRSLLSIMPQEYQWLRLDGINDNALIKHWTGRVGKEYIRKIMLGASPADARKLPVPRTIQRSGRPAPPPVRGPRATPLIALQRNNRRFLVRKPLK